MFKESCNPTECIAICRSREYVFRELCESSGLSLDGDLSRFGLSVPNINRYVYPCNGIDLNDDL